MYIVLVAFQNDFYIATCTCLTCTQAGHIYICDMRAMDELPTKKTYFNVAPICLLYVKKNKKLVPIAIQLRQGVSEEDKKIGNPIFLPSDNWIDWTLAKMYYQSAHSQVQNNEYMSFYSQI